MDTRLNNHSCLPVVLSSKNKCPLNKQPARLATATSPEVIFLQPTTVAGPGHWSLPMASLRSLKMRRVNKMSPFYCFRASLTEAGRFDCKCTEVEGWPSRAPRRPAPDSCGGASSSTPSALRPIRARVSNRGKGDQLLSIVRISLTRGRP